MSLWRPGFWTPVHTGGGGGGSVTLDSAGTVAHINSATSTSGSHTVAGSNRGLLIVGALSGVSASGLAATWDQGGTNQAMTLLASVTSTNAGGALSFAFGLLAPTLGTKTFQVTRAAAGNIIACPISFNGVLQSAVLSAFLATTAFDHTGLGSTPATITESSATGRMVVGVSSQDFTAYGSVNETQLFIDGTRTLISAAANYAAGAASKTLSHTIGSACDWGMVGVDVVPA